MREPSHLAPGRRDLEVRSFPKPSTYVSIVNCDVQTEATTWPYAARAISDPGCPGAPYSGQPVHDRSTPHGAVPCA